MKLQELLGEDTTPNELTMDKLLRTPARLGVGILEESSKLSTVSPPHIMAASLRIPSVTEYIHRFLADSFEIWIDLAEEIFHIVSLCFACLMHV